MPYFLTKVTSAVRTNDFCAEHMLAAHFASYLLAAFHFDLNQIEFFRRDDGFMISLNIVLGYEHDENGKLAIKPDEAEIVCRVYAAYLEGRRFHAIARELTEKGVPSPNGKAQWCNRTIDIMLSNEKYAGDVILFKTVSAEDLFAESLAETMKRKTYKITESHPAIISKEDFERVQQMKAKRSRKKIDYLENERDDE